MRTDYRFVAEEIQRYCAAHPDARDTIDGIVWWVQMQRQEDERSRVRAAVGWLVQQGALQRFQLQDGTELFGSVGPCRADFQQPPGT